VNADEIGKTAAAITSLIPGPWGILATLVASEGIPFVDHLIQNSKNNTPVTPDAWLDLRAKAKTPFQDL